MWITRDKALFLSQFTKSSQKWITIIIENYDFLGKNTIKL